MKGTFLLILILCLTATLIAFKKDPQLANDGFFQGLKMLWKILPILVVAFILAGMMEKIIPRDPDFPRYYRLLFRLDMEIILKILNF